MPENNYIAIAVMPENSDVAIAVMPENNYLFSTKQKCDMMYKGCSFRYSPFYSRKTGGEKLGKLGLIYFKISTVLLR